MFPQLGPNPSYLDAQCLGRGESGCLMAGCTLYMVNQSHPFTVEFVGNSNEKSSSPQKKGKAASESRDRPRISNDGPGPKRSIQDYFSKSPKKVSRTILTELLGKIFKTMLHYSVQKLGDNNTFILQECIQFIKSNSKEITKNYKILIF